MKKVLFALLGALATSSMAQEVGSYGFLELPVSSHAAALGGVAISVVEPEAELALQNPSLLCPEMSGQVSLSYMNYVNDINLASAIYTGAFLDYGAWSGGIRYCGYGDFQGYDEHGVSTGSFSAKDIAFHYGIGYPLSDRWRVGAMARGIYSKYADDAAFAVGVDVGLNYYNEVAGRSFSVTLTQLGGQLKSFEGRRSHMPTQLAIGLTKEVEHLPFCFTLTAYNLFDWDQDYVNGAGTTHHYTNAEQVLNHLLWGVEWIASDDFYLAAGYSFRRQREFSGNGGFLRGLSFGGGLQWRQFRVGCSYARYNAVDGSLLVNFTCRL